MRKSLAPSLLSVILRNQGYKKEIRIFELANTYRPRENKLPNEYLNLTLVLTGDKTEEKFYALKGVCENLFKKLGIKEKYEEAITSKIKSHPYLIQSRTALIKHDKINTPLGYLGIIKPEVLKNFGLNEKIIIASLDFDTIASLTTTKKSYTPIPKHPPIIEDLTFVIKPGTYIKNLIQLIKECSLMIQNVELVDSYKNSRTLRIIYQHPKRNLTDKEVKIIREKIIESIKNKLGVELKSK